MDLKTPLNLLKKDILLQSYFSLVFKYSLRVKICLTIVLGGERTNLVISLHCQMYSVDFKINVMEIIRRTEGVKFWVKNRLYSI